MCCVCMCVGLCLIYMLVWGDIVNVASRMQSTALPDTIQVHETVFNATTHSNLAFSFEERGVISVKGKGLMRTWHLTACDAMH